MLPRALLDALRPAALVVEVGVGGRHETLRALRATRPDLRVRATDVRPEALHGLPPGVEGVVDDLHRPRAEVYAGAALLYVVRPGEEMQPALARLARTVGAPLAVRPLGSELADLAPWLGPAQVARGADGSAWHVFGA